MTAVKTMPPPIKVACTGTSLNKSQAHNGAKGASSAPIKAVSIGGSILDPKAKHMNPAAWFTMPKAARLTMSSPEGSAPLKGKEIIALIKVERHAAARRSM